MIGTHSLIDMIKMYNKNKDVINAYIKGESIEGFRMKDINGSDVDLAPTGAMIGVFVSLILLSAFLWVWGIMVLVRYWSILPEWAQILGLVGLLGFGGPILTLIVVYVAKGHATP